jgi:HEAT repeats
MTFLSRRVLWTACLVLVVAGSASAQLDGRLYLDKTTYLVGEPVYLNFELANNGGEAVQFESGDSYSFCGGYRVDVGPVRALSNTTCSGGIGGSCPSGTWVLEPGKTRDDKVLLNYDHDLSKPGLYTIHAARYLRYGPVTEVFPRIADESQFKVEAEFQIQLVDAGDESALVPMFQPFIAELQSKDERRQREAARVIGSLAPSFLEDTILSMLDSPVTRPFALMGLWHLNTARSREALAKTAEDASGDSRKASYSYNSLQALQYLSQMSDKEYFPLLLDEAKKREPNQAYEYVMAAAELGGGDAMPFLVSLLSSSDPFSRANAVEGLAQTGARDAVPLLMQELLDSDVDLARIASSGLVRLTHRSPLDNDRLWAESPRSEYPQWQQWWAVHGADAPIFAAGKCGPIEPLR